MITLQRIRAILLTTVCLAASQAMAAVSAIGVVHTDGTGAAGSTVGFNDFFAALQSATSPNFDTLGICGFSSSIPPNVIPP